MASNGKELVLVTGGSGFLGVHCILKCLSANYRVRTTIRTLPREKDVRDMLTAGNATNLEDVTFIEADLAKDDGWNEAVKDCAYVLHVASPFPMSVPKHEDDIIIPARQGTLRVLRAARDAGVRRVVITSSFGAVAYGHEDWDTSKPFTEKDWTNPDGPGVSAYIKSKTVAERAAWDFVEEEGGNLELTVIQPTAIFGPILGPDFSPSVEIVLRLMNGSLPGCPRLSWGIIDVRDAADLHLIAMTHPKAKGERFLCVSPPVMTVKEISLALRERLGAAAKRCPTRDLPNFLLRLIALFDPAVALVTPELDKIKPASNDKARNLLGWEPRSNVDAIVASAESLINFGVIKT
ncbi:nucleoside-diphosphate-sugar epimerase [Rhizodiscina lignyota]|uniref:Nucleoside-diphosphate-sugar epimerase n=1 Tax=Rhizodiscina lignyota TaxID=1504668 RepID=A0A9P4IM35_9PEZI|nr:nucleoside-diphosphate-sugar epimerase [Rhizodiscina lignyota]